MVALGSINSKFEFFYQLIIVLKNEVPNATLGGFSKSEISQQRAKEFPRNFSKQRISCNSKKVIKKQIPNG